MDAETVSPTLINCPRASIPYTTKTMTNFNQISHFSHPNHTLKLEYSEIPFKCDGCKEVGIGSHYTCAICDFDLHMHCANYSLLSSTLTTLNAPSNFSNARLATRHPIAMGAKRMLLGLCTIAINVDMISTHVVPSSLQTFMMGKSVCIYIGK